MWCWWPTLSLFAFDGRMALAALWGVPVSAAIVMGSYRVQDKVQAKTMAARMAVSFTPRKPRILMQPARFSWKTYVLKVSQSKFSTQHIQEVYLTTVSV